MLLSYFSCLEDSDVTPRRTQCGECNQAVGDTCACTCGAWLRHLLDQRVPHKPYCEEKTFATGQKNRLSRQELHEITFIQEPPLVTSDSPS